MRNNQVNPDYSALRLLTALVSVQSAFSGLEQPTAPPRPYPLDCGIYDPRSTCYCLRREDLFISSNRIFRKASECGLGRSVGVPAAIRSGASSGENRITVRVEGSMGKMPSVKTAKPSCASMAMNSAAMSSEV